MSEKNDGGSVYPLPSEWLKFDGKSKHGITRRDWLAGLALQGMLASGKPIGDAANFKAGSYATHAYILADALIEEGEK